MKTEANNKSVNIDEQTEKTEIIQRSIQVPKDIWVASGCIPGGRTKYIIESLANAIDARKSELPKLRLEVAEHLADRQRLDAIISAKNARIAELEAAQENEIRDAIQIQRNVEQAVIETMRLLKDFRRDLTKSHYRRLSDLSGTPAIDIEEFIKEYKYRPSEEQIREFFLR